MLLLESLLLLLALERQSSVSSFIPQPNRRVSRPIKGRTIVTSPAVHGIRQHAKKGNDDDDDLPPGMMDAFKQLESLDSLNPKLDAMVPPPQKKISVDKEVLPISENGQEASIPPEKEVQIYADMMKDLESTDEDDLYSNVMAELGGEAVKPSQPVPPPPAVEDTSTVLPPTANQQDMDKFMDTALNEALEEVKLKSGDSLSPDSILNDKEIMKEIEAIFDRGNEQLMESLEEIRKEQQVMAQQSAATSAQNAADASSETAERLANAESSMAAMLDRVSNEAIQVEKAAQDLRDAQAELDKDFVVKLRNGGIPKQASLVGFLLFSLRSISDTIGAIGSDEQSLLASGLLQGGIALVCAVIFFVL